MSATEDMFKLCHVVKIESMEHIYDVQVLVAVGRAMTVGP